MSEYSTAPIFSPKTEERVRELAREEIKVALSSPRLPAAEAPDETPLGPRGRRSSGLLMHAWTDPGEPELEHPPVPLRLYRFPEGPDEIWMVHDDGEWAPLMLVGRYATNELIRLAQTLSAKATDAPPPASLLDTASNSLRWLLHLHHGVSRGGEDTPITDAEWKAALRSAQFALAAIENYEPPAAPDEGCTVAELQDAVRRKLIELAGAPESAIDGSGTDGDEVELTLAEIEQAWRRREDNAPDEGAGEGTEQSVPAEPCLSFCLRVVTAYLDAEAAIGAPTDAPVDLAPSLRSWLARVEGGGGSFKGVSTADDARDPAPSAAGRVVAEPELLRALDLIAEAMRAPDDHATSRPMFLVQDRRRIYGLNHNYTDEPLVWLNEDGYEVVLEDGATPPETWEQVGYLDVWEHVTTCFSRAGAEAFIARERHDLRDPRVYVASGHRNAEWRAARDFLLGLRPAPRLEPRPETKGRAARWRGKRGAGKKAPTRKGKR